MPLISSEINIDLSWSKHFVVSEISRTPEVTGANTIYATQKNRATFPINKTKLYVPLGTLSINGNIMFLENLKQGFKRTISSKKIDLKQQHSQKTERDYIIHHAFRNTNRLFALLIKNGNEDPKRDLFDIYYMLLVLIEDFNALDYNKSFFNQPVKNKQEAYRKIAEIQRNDDYATGNLLDLLYHQNYYKLTGLDLLWQIDANIRDEEDFKEKLGEDNDAIIFFIAEKQQKATKNCINRKQII